MEIDTDTVRLAIGVGHHVTQLIDSEIPLTPVGHAIGRECVVDIPV
jgi:hypothetical protein